MSGNVDHADDYTYDLAHEVKTMKVPSQRKAAPFKGVRGVPFEPDQDADFGYDQAHEADKG